MIAISAPKILGDWQNEGPCNSIISVFASVCEDGIQIQTRTCTNGTVDICTDEDMHRITTCKKAGVQLPDCSKFKRIIFYSAYTYNSQKICYEVNIIIYCLVCPNDFSCLNGGTCVDDSCSCPSGIKGFKCEKGNNMQQLLTYLTI